MRGKNEGSVFQLPSKKWRAQISIGNGKYATRTCATQKEAIAALRALKKEQDSGVVTRGDLTVNDILDYFQNVVEPVAKRTEGTKNRNRGQLDAWRDVIGTKKVATLRPVDVHAAMVEMNKGRGKLYGERTLMTRKTLLAQAFDEAIRVGMISQNPAKLAHVAPGAEPTVRRSLSIEQVEILISSTADRRNGAMFALGCQLGLRPGELLGLTWDAVDFDAGTLHIWQTVNMDSGRPELLQRTKTTSSTRTLALPAHLIEILRDHRLAQMVEIKSTGRDDFGLLFPTKFGGPIALGNFGDCFRSICSGLGFGDDWKPHEMRHTFASILVDQGVPLELIAACLGHSTTTILERTYRHALRVEKTGHLATMSALFGKS